MGLVAWAYCWACCGRVCRSSSMRHAAGCVGLANPRRCGALLASKSSSMWPVAGFQILVDAARCWLPNPRWCSAWLAAVGVANPRRCGALLACKSSSVQCVAGCGWACKSSSMRRVAGSSCRFLLVGVVWALIVMDGSYGLSSL